MPITLSSYEFTNTELFHKPITHDAIKKFGIDMTQKATPANGGSSYNSIEKVSANECPGLLSIYKAFDTIQISKHNYGKIDNNRKELNKINGSLDLVNRLNEIDKEKYEDSSIMTSLIFTIILILILIVCIFMFYKIVTKKINN